MQMRLVILFVVGLRASPTYKERVLPDPEVSPLEIDENEKDITEINKDLNLPSDDIISNLRNTINDADKLWTIPVPYVLDANLDMNAKGVTMRAFEQYRLKSCIDFKVRDSEEYYINVEKQNGCFSYIGRVFLSGQTLSIGQFCDTIAIVEHEFLHALGFYHEQSRYDRDEYVTIIFDNILAGKEHNFDKVSQEESSTQGTAYDFNSVMHYGRGAFTNGNGDTIITTDPAFQDVIGQRREMSANDIVKLNRLYSCNSTIAFRMNCDFSDAAICGMSGCSGAESAGGGWERLASVSGGPDVDHTNLTEQGYFMHASTASSQDGNSSWLQTQGMTPIRECHVQCLQFYYYHSGNQSDQLNIWIREFQNDEDSTGQLRLMGQITGSQTSQWQFHHVSLNASKPFQVEFEVRKGQGDSSGGFSIDDINLSEIECPHLSWQLNDFENLLSTSSPDSYLFSERQYSSGGYAYQIAIRLFETYFGLYVRLVSGDNDDQLQWPCPWRQVTFLMLDQNPNIQLQMSKQRSFTSDPNNSILQGVWGKPCEVGTLLTDGSCVNLLYGWRHFANLDDMMTRDFLKGGNAVFLFSFQDISPLVNGSALPNPTLRPVNFTQSHNHTVPCSPRNTPTTSPPTTDDIRTTSTTSPLKTTDYYRAFLWMVLVVQLWA